MASQATPSDRSILPRVAAQHLTAAAAVMPVVVVMGARQTGKSTLVRSHPVFGKYPYVTLDNSDIREQAAADPAGLLARSPHLVIDEVQRDEEHMHSRKEYIDDQPRRTPGQFVLTGCANLLAMKKIRE